MTARFFVAGITGDAALDRKLLNLERKTRRDLMKRGLKKGAKVLADEVRQRAPVKTGLMKSRFKVRAQKRSRKDKDGIGFNVVTSAGFYTGKAFYAGFLVFGHRLGKRSAGMRRKASSELKNTGRGRKGLGKTTDTRPKVDPHPFMQQAFDAKKDEAARVIAEQIKADMLAAAITG